MTNILLVVALGLSSIYIFPSGYPQVGDGVWVLFIGSILWQILAGRLFVRRDAFLGVWFALVLWVAAVNLVWVLIYQQTSPEIAYLMLWPPLFYWFNFLVGFSLLVYLQQVPAARIMLIYGVAISLFICAVGVLLGIGAQGRVTAFFNNPNQLAHYALCGISVILIAYGGRIPMQPVPLAAVGCGIVSIFGPASLGAMAGLVLIGAGWLAANSQHMRRFLQAALVGLVLVVSVLGFDHYTGGGIAESVTKRFTVSERKMADLQEGGRGYDRVLAYPQYLVLGAGEGAWRLRFEPFHQGVEIHSSLGTLLFCYGVVGLGLFLVLVLIVIRGAPLYVMFLIGGLLAYSITHLGLRTTMFWIVLVAAQSLKGCWSTVEMSPRTQRGFQMAGLGR